MEYTYPQYFYDFQCEASDCSDTCCRNWRIAIDPVSRKKYRKYPGPFGNRLRNSIDWEEGVFEQYDGRCAFLSDEGLCDIITEAGSEMLCKTCTRYPRHYEEYENLREISLSLSCPAAAKLVLGSDEKTTFLSECRETPEEEYEQFDFFLFTKLQEIRDYLYEVVQDRKLPIGRRMAQILAVSHDLQKRIDRRQLYEVDDLLKRYRSPKFAGTAERKFAAYKGKKEERREEMERIWKRLCRLEPMRPQWPELLQKYERLLYRELTDGEYGQAADEFAAFYKDKEYEYEQILMYFIFTYLCGAVYDEDAFGKVKLAVVSVMLIRELDMARWLEQDRQFAFDDQIDLVHRYSREVEHSDPNVEALETMMADEEPFELEALLAGILG